MIESNDTRKIVNDSGLIPNGFIKNNNGTLKTPSRNTNINTELDNK